MIDFVSTFVGAVAQRRCGAATSPLVSPLADVTAVHVRSLEWDLRRGTLDFVAGRSQGAVYGARVQRASLG